MSNISYVFPCPVVVIAEGSDMVRISTKVF